MNTDTINRAINNDIIKRMRHRAYWTEKFSHPSRVQYNYSVLSNRDLHYNLYNEIANIYAMSSRDPESPQRSGGYISTCDIPVFTFNNVVTYTDANNEKKLATNPILQTFSYRDPATLSEDDMRSIRIKQEEFWIAELNTRRALIDEINDTIDEALRRIGEYNRSVRMGYKKYDTLVKLLDTDTEEITEKIRNLLFSSNRGEQ